MQPTHHTSRPSAESARDLPTEARAEITILKTRRGYTVTAKTTNARGLELPTLQQPAKGAESHKDLPSAIKDAEARAAAFTDEARGIAATITSKTASNAGGWFKFNS